MKDFTLAIYCFIDDLLLQTGKNSVDKRRKLNDSQIITAAILSAKYFYGNQSHACAYLKDHWEFNIPDKSNFNRILHRLSDKIICIFYYLSPIIKELNLESVYIIDSFPVIVCKNIRISRSKILTEEKYRSYNASKREYFYGFKIHVISTATGIPVEFLFTAASVHDNTALQMMDIDLPQNSHLYADSAYLNGDLKDLLLLDKAIKLKAATKKNSLEKNTWLQELENKYFRKRIENTFADINVRFPKKIHAVTANGFLLKLIIAILTLILDKI